MEEDHEMTTPMSVYRETLEEEARERPVSAWERGKFLLVAGVLSKPELNGQIVELYDNKGRLDTTGVERFKCGLWDSPDKKVMLLKADNLRPVPLPTDEKLLTELATIAFNVDNISRTLRNGRQCDRKAFMRDAQLQLARALEIWPPSGALWQFRENFLYFEKNGPHAGVRAPSPVASAAPHEAQALPMLWRALGNCVPDDVTMNLAIRTSLAQELNRTAPPMGTEAWRENYRLRCDLYRSLVQRYNPSDVDTWPNELADVLIRWCREKSGLSDAEREATAEESLEILVRLKAKARTSRLTSAISGRNEEELVNAHYASACQRLWWLAVEQENKGRLVIAAGGALHCDEACAHFFEAERILTRAVERWGDDDPATAAQLQYVKFRLNRDVQVQEFPHEPITIKGDPSRVGITPVTQAGRDLISSFTK